MRCLDYRGIAVVFVELWNLRNTGVGNFPYQRILVTRNPLQVYRYRPLLCIKCAKRISITRQAIAIEAFRLIAKRSKIDSHFPRNDDIEFFSQRSAVSLGMSRYEFAERFSRDTRDPLLTLRGPSGDRRGGPAQFRLARARG